MADARRAGKRYEGMQITRVCAGVCVVGCRPAGVVC